MVTLSISGVDRTEHVAWESVRIENILTKQVDRCTFKIRAYGTKTYKPVVGRQVVIEENGTRVFGGVIVRVTEAVEDYKLQEYTVECSDYTRILDQHLIAETYEDMTVNEIIDDIIANWAPVGFTATQVDAPLTIDYIQFKYEPVSDAIRQLADILGYDWYVDYDKDIYFKSPIATVAPTDIEDDNGTHVYNSLVIRRDNSQLRNSIIVRGGEYVGTEFTSEIVADGEQVIFPLGYKYTDFGATLTGNPLSLGIDYIGNPDSYDAMYNFGEKILRFKEADKPSAGAILRVSGRPHLPVIVRVKSQPAIDAIFSAEDEGDGEYEFLVNDKSINTQVAARERAAAEINSYGETLSEGEFETETTGFKAGQKVRINSVSRGIDEEYIINKVISVTKDTTAFRYRVSLITTKTMDFISIMKKLLLQENKKIVITDDELLNLIESQNETITVSDMLSTLTGGDSVASETITLGEAFTPQALDYGVQFVLTPQVPTGTLRPFILNGSKLS